MSLRVEDDVRDTLLSLSKENNLKINDVITLLVHNFHIDSKNILNEFQNITNEQFTKLYSIKLQLQSLNKSDIHNEKDLQIIYSYITLLLKSIQSFKTQQEILDLISKDNKIIDMIQKQVDKEGAKKDGN